MEKLEPRISMIALGVKDLKRATSYYQKIGWELSGQSKESISFFKLQGIVLSLYEVKALAEDATMEHQELPEFKGQSLCYNCRSETEVDGFYKLCLEAGATSAKAPEKTFWGGYGAYVLDPEGHLWELAFNPFVKFKENGELEFE